MAATPTNANLRGGYEYSFVNTPPDELVCKICHHPSREPHLSVCCGHTFCKTCLEDAKQAVTVDKEVKNSCPMCREKNFSAFQNKRDERAVKSLHVFCTNKEEGCDWQGEMNIIVGHLANSDGCPFEEVGCANECGLSLQRQNLSRHVDIECPRSKVTCQYCSIIGERQFITGQHHEEECPKLPLPCPNKCEIKTVPRENMEAHRAKCPLETIQCEWCNLSLQRQHLSMHVDTECPHSIIPCQYCNTIGERQFINGHHQKEECSKFPLSCPNNCMVGTVLRENMEAHRAECPLEMIQCEYYEMGCKDSMARKDKVKHNKEEVENHLSLMKSEYLQTKGKLADTEKRIRELESSMEHRIQLVENMMFKHLFQWYTTLEERVKSQHTKVPVTLKMSNYSRKRENDSDWYSDSFSWLQEVSLGSSSWSWRLKRSEYHMIEVKLQARIIPAGYDNGKGTHLSVQLYLVKGGRKPDFIAQEHQIVDQLQQIESARKGVLTMAARLGPEEQKRVKMISELKMKKEELMVKQKWWEKNSLVHLHMMILNQITDSEHYSVQTNQIDLKADHFLTNKDCNVLIFDSPCFVSNEVLYKSTATCRYLQDDNVYFLIKAA